MMDRNVKDFFDTLKDTANVVGETVAEVTRESAKKLGVKKDAAKLNMEVLRIRAGIEGIYSEIGKETYALHVCDDELEAEERQNRIDDLLVEIDGRQEQIVQLNKRIDLLNGGLCCTECGRVSPADYEFCPTCGAKLTRPETETCCCAEDDGCCCAEDAECCCEEEKEGTAECSCCCPSEAEAESAEACGCDACGCDAPGETERA